MDTDTGDAVYGTGGGITWDSEPAAEHAEVLAKAAVLSARPREFELLETMRYEPRRGLRNRDRHLRRLAESAEHLGFRFDRHAVAGGSVCAAQRVAARHGSGCGCTAPERRPSTWRRCPPPCRGPSSSRSTTSRSTRSSGGCTTRRRFREPYDRRRLRHPDVDDVIMVNTRARAHRGHPGHRSPWRSTGPGTRLRWRPGASRASSAPACSTSASCRSGCCAARTWRRPRGWQ